MSFVDPLGQLFLQLERRSQPMHVGGLQLFALPEGATPDYVRRFVARARCFDDVQPPFDQRLTRRFGRPAWTRDDALDPEYHVRHLALPEPGAVRDLLALVSMLHGAMLDRARPLWEMYVIEGLTDNRFAIYTKFHHAMMDGVSAMQVLRKCLVETPDAEALHMPWALPRRGAERSRQTASPVRHALSNSLRQAAAVPRTASALYESWRDARHDPDFTGPIEAPACMLNTSVSGARRFAAQGYSLTRIRGIADHFGTTINDVVLAMCASALRQYLIDNNGLPTKPLIGLVPMSLHAGDGETGNKLAAIYANLATNVADPVDRLLAIQRSVDYWKRRYRQMSPEQIVAFTAAISAPAGVNLLTGLAPRHQAFNLVISNVPGPKNTLYFGDARLTGMYPISVTLDGQALNITLTSYDDAIEFGLIGCRRSLPSMQNLLKYLGHALDELEPPDRTGAPQPPRA